MISFKEFLAEQNYPLYHGTNIEGLTAIIKQDKLQSGSFDSMRAHSQSSLMNNRGTISTSRDLKFAKYWSARVSGLWMDPEFENRTVVIELDREKLRHRTRIIPYNHFHDKSARREQSDKRWLYGPMSPKGLDGNQYEERLLGSVPNVSKYITKIHLAPEAKEYLEINRPNLLNKISKWL